MIVGLVRDSVLKCFCHTCRAPIASTNISGNRTSITNTIQPKKRLLVSTEVRCQEKTKGGLRYEVVLSEPEIKTVPPKKITSPRSNMSAYELDSKLKAAEDRRQQIESNKIAMLSGEMSKIAQATRKREEQTLQFISATRNALEQKMECHNEKRELYITDLKTKLKDHMENIEKTRLTLEQQTSDIKLTLEEKMKTASTHREENIKKMLERLKEQEEQAKKIRTSHLQKMNQLERIIRNKLNQATKRRSMLEQIQKERLHNYNTRSTSKKGATNLSTEIRKAEVSVLLENRLVAAEKNRDKEVQRKTEKAKRHNEHMNQLKHSIEYNQENRKFDTASKIETKLAIAEQNRGNEIKRKIENIKKNDKRAEMVRQNKASIAATANETAIN